MSYEAFFHAGLRHIADHTSQGPGKKPASASWTSQKLRQDMARLQELWQELTPEEQGQANAWVLAMWGEDPSMWHLIDMPLSLGMSSPPRAYIFAWGDAPLEWPSLWGYMCSWCNQIYSREEELPKSCSNCGASWNHGLFHLKWHDTLRSLIAQHRKLRDQGHSLESAERPGKEWVGFLDKTTNLWHRYTPGKEGTKRWKSEYATPEAREVFFRHEGSEG